MNFFLVSEFDGLTVISCKTEVEGDPLVSLKSAAQIGADRNASVKPVGKLIGVLRRIAASVTPSLTIPTDNNLERSSAVRQSAEEVD
jgi:hypothetical protein